MDFRQGMIITVFLLFSGSFFGLGTDKGEVLDLSGKKINRSLKIEHPENIKILILDSCSLTELPPVLSSLIRLEHLSLQNNPALSLDQLCKGIKSLSKLRFLNLSNNGIRELTDAFSGLKIKELKLSDNRLNLNSSIPILRTMPMLERLWMDGNQLKEFPLAVLNFPQLRVLYAYNNEMSAIELSDPIKTSLWVLHLGNNAFEELPVALTKMKGLRMALFNQNLILSIPSAFGASRYSMNALILDANPLNTESRMKGAKYFKKMMMYSDE